LIRLASSNDGIGGGAHAPDEFFLIDSKNPKIAGLDGATTSFVDFFYALAATR
jgi:hypothetical protein